MLYVWNRTLRLSRYGIGLQNRTAIYWAFILFAPLWATLREAARSLPSRMEIREGKRIQRLRTKSAPNVNKTQGRAHPLVQM